jgi:hypothetical protein
MLKTVGNPSTRNGDQTIVDGNLVIGTAGKGIDFSAASHAAGMTSELLDDYEEGIATTGVTCTTSGTINLQTSFHLAYTKIGDLVHVQGYLYVGSVSSPVGAMRVALPFTAADLTGSAGASVASVWITNANAANVADFVAQISEGTAYIEIQLGDATSAQSDSAQEMKAGSQIRVSAQYKVA